MTVAGPPQVSITGHTQLVGLFGWPVEHSISPPMHNAAFAHLELDWCYLPFAVSPDALGNAVRGIRALGLRGVNATIPHKQALLTLMDELTPEAQALGAVNTVLLQEGRLVGHNTDAAGFRRAMGQIEPDLEGKRALILGAGGAARAVAYALAGAGVRLVILNRTEHRAFELAQHIGRLFPTAELRSGPLDAPTVDAAAPVANLVVNTTSVGMWPATEASPWPDGVPFPAEALVYDLIYNPAETALMRQAHRRGAATHNGLSMLVHQGAEAFRLWTGIEAPVDVMSEACLAALGGAN